MDPKKVLVLLSGGMDSVTALHHIASQRDAYEIVGVLSFDYKSKHNDKEWEWARYHSRLVCEGVPHHRIPLDFMGDLFNSNLLKKGEAIPDGHYEASVMKKTVVPFRNGIMLAIAAGYAESIGATGVVIAAHAGDHAIYPDCRREFMEAMEAAIRLGTYAQVDLVAPFIDKSKADIVSIGAALHINYATTWSCYKGGELHCGRCGTCIERREAFYLAGVPDPTPYAPDAPSVEELVAKNWRLE